MKRTLPSTVAILLTTVACGGSSPEASAPIAQPDPPAMDTQTPTAVPAAKAPAFALPDANSTPEGNTVELESFAGKTVVLEWFNPGCPFVKYAHGEGPLSAMAGFQKDDVVWLAINSSAPGKQGHGARANKNAAKQWKMDHPVLLDEDGTTGQAYGATSTPAMFVINPSGELIYEGALDNAPLGKAEGEDGLVNYVEEAIKASQAGTLPATRKTQSYGCSVKYAQN